MKIYMQTKPFVTGLLVLAVAALFSACKPPSPPPQKEPLISLLAQDVRFSIAGQVVRLPLAAVSWAGHSNVLTKCEPDDRTYECPISLEEISTKKSNKNEPIPITAVDITLQHLEDFYDLPNEHHIVIPELCGRLAQDWARNICQEGIADVVLGVRLERFSLVDTRRINNWKGSWISGAEESSGESVRKMNLVGSEPSISCGKDKNGSPLTLCAAAMQVRKNLLAIWIVHINPTRQQDFLRQAKAIKAFMTFGISETENFSAMRAALL